MIQTFCEIREMQLDPKRNWHTLGKDPSWIAEGTVSSTQTTKAFKDLFSNQAIKQKDFCRRDVDRFSFRTVLLPSLSPCYKQSGNSRQSETLIVPDGRWV